MCARVHVHAPTLTQMHTYSHTHTYTHKHTYMYMYSSVYTFIVHLCHIHIDSSPLCSHDIWPICYYYSSLSVSLTLPLFLARMHVRAVSLVYTHTHTHARQVQPAAITLDRHYTLQSLFQRFSIHFAFCRSDSIQSPCPGLFSWERACWQFVHVHFQILRCEKPIQPRIPSHRLVWISGPADEFGSGISVRWLDSISIRTYHIYIHTYTYTYMCMCMRMCVCVFMYIYMIYTYIYMYVCVRVCACVCMRVCAWCACAYLCLYLYWYAHITTRIYICVFGFRNLHINQGKTYAY